MEYKTLKEEKILDYLVNNINDMTKKKAKNLLKYKEISVNQKTITNANYMLKKGDMIAIVKNRLKNDFEIIYEDHNIIVVNKKAGLLTISTENEKINTLYHKVSQYVKSKNKNNNIFIIHRLDRDTSGVVMFAKSEKIKKLYQNNWNDLVIGRYYVAIVEGVLEKKRGIINSKLKENKEGYVYCSKDGKEAITEYKVIKENKLYSLLKINIKTGRKNQIRVHMKSINHPIVGDKKYGSKKKEKRLYLHASILELKNPITGKIEKYSSKIPEQFNIKINDKSLIKYVIF